jgi:hypothetical protein
VDVELRLDGDDGGDELRLDSIPRGDLDDVRVMSAVVMVGGVAAGDSAATASTSRSVESAIVTRETA